MDIKDCRIDMMVKAPNGYEAKIVEIQKNGRVFVDFSPRGYNYMPFAASELTPVSDPCTDCQKKLDAAVEYWKAACEEARDGRDRWKRSATYWRSELSKLQKEALSDSESVQCLRERVTALQNMIDYEPMSEVAKIYIQVSPDELNRILKERD